MNKKWIILCLIVIMALWGCKTKPVEEITTPEETSEAAPEDTAPEETPADKAPEPEPPAPEPPAEEPEEVAPEPEKEAPAEAPEAKASHLVIASFNDFQGTVLESKADPGAAKIGTLVEMAYQEEPNLVIVSGGDNYQGSPLSEVFNGSPVNLGYSMMDLAASAVGTGEFGWPDEFFKIWSEEGQFAYLAANIFTEETGELVPWALPYAIKEIDGRQVAFIGLITQLAPLQVTVGRTEGLVFGNPAEAADQWVQFLKAGKAGVTPDVIVALAHIESYQQGESVADPTSVPVTGPEELIKLSQVEGIDAIITAGSEENVAGYLNGVPVIQGQKNCRSVGLLYVYFNGDQALVLPSVENITPLKDYLPGNKMVSEYLDHLSFELGIELDEIIGRALSPISNKGKGVTPMGGLVAEALRLETGSDICLIDGKDIHAGLKQGDVTLLDAAGVVGYDRTLVTFSLTGAEIRSAIQNGLKFPEIRSIQYAGLNGTYYQREDELELFLSNGQRLEDSKIYQVVTLNFMARDWALDLSDVEFTETYIKALNVLVNRFKMIDGAAALPLEGILTLPGRGPDMDEVLAVAEANVADSGEFVTPLGYYLASSLMESAGADIGLIDSDTVSGAFSKGKVTRKNLYNSFSPEATLAVYQIPGSELFELVDKYLFMGLQFSGLKAEYDSDSLRLTSLFLPDGSPVDMDGMYTIAAANPHMGFDVDGDTGDSAVEVLASYLMKEGSISEVSVEGLVKKAPIPTTVWKVKKETVLFDTEELDEYTVNEYDGESRILSSVTYGLEDEVLSSVAYTYDEMGYLVREEESESGALMSYMVFVNDEEGNPLSEETYDSDDELVFKSEYEYDEEGRKTVRVTYDSDLVPLMFIYYTYKGDDMVRYDMFNPVNELEAYVDYVYSKKGELEAEQTKSSAGEIESQNKYEYKGGKRSLMRSYRSRLNFSEEYEYDQEGNVSAVRVFDRKGRLSEIRLYEYVSFVVLVEAE